MDSQSSTIFPVLGHKMFIDLLKEFRSMGCTSEKQCAISCRIYLNLRNLVEENNIEKFYDEYFKTIFFHCNVEGASNIYWPISGVDEIDMKLVTKVQEVICKPKCGNLILSICDPSGTNMYYKMTKTVEE